MGSIKLYLNRGKGTVKSRPIMLSYHFNGHRLIYFTGLRISETQFNRKAKDPAKSDCIDRIYINGRLKLIRNMIGEIENEALAGGKPVTPEYFREQLNERLKTKPNTEPEVERKISLKEFFGIYIEEIPNRVNKQTGRKLSHGMVKKYGTIKNLFNEFCAFESHEYDFDDIDESFYRKFLAFMLNEKKYSVNTYGRAFKFLKTVINEATNRGINTSLEYKDVLIGATEESDSIYLTEDELQRMHQLNLNDTPGLEKVRDLFLIGCYTGLRFSDYTTVRKDDIKGDRIRVQSQKTKEKVVIPLSKVATEILKKYDYQLPKPISNQKFNEALKKIALKANIKEDVVQRITRAGATETTVKPKHELVTSHVARRSFATNSVKRGIQPMLIMAITGHKTESEFQKYVKLSREELADLFAQKVDW